MSNKIDLLSHLIKESQILGLPEADVQHAVDFLEHHEYSLCLDQIITQLYEFDIKITQDFFILIEQTASKIHFPENEYSLLKELIT